MSLYPFDWKRRQSEILIAQVIHVKNCESKNENEKEKARETGRALHGRSPLATPPIAAVAAPPPYDQTHGHEAAPVPMPAPAFLPRCLARRCSCRRRHCCCFFVNEFSKLNPITYVPALADGDFVLTDSFTILMYLEERYRQHHPLLPSDLKKRAINNQAANIVSSSIQPLQNLYVLKFLEEKVGPSEPLAWVQFHIGRGFSALEKVLADHAGKYAAGEEVCLV
ncbi:glutathione S-transferase zeta class-like [Syzygium oleosum]|uniref:glutathione S-transferase zeta class-like n=1 Tax=Syzygium oleosum TaxID=219896 RepID=UPI0024BA0FAE|nr:glutathione S-transferase zeta class-like [Syzygium oleosum]